MSQADHPLGPPDENTSVRSASPAPSIRSPARWPGFPWWIRAWRLTRCTMMHRIHRQAPFHHDLLAAGCLTMHWCTRRRCHGSRPRRTDVPGHLWTDLLRAARRNVDVLAFAGLFLAEEHSGWLPALTGKAGTNARIRLLLGDPDSSQLAARDREYSIGGGVAGRVSAVLSYYRQMPDEVELRLHDTPLYNSIYRFDDEMLVNVHAYGILAAYTPVMHLRRVDGAFFNTYLESFERVWASAIPGIASPTATVRSGCPSTCACTASRSAASWPPTPNLTRPRGLRRTTWTATTSTLPSGGGSAMPCTTRSHISTSAIQQRPLPAWPETGSM